MVTHIYLRLDTTFCVIILLLLVQGQEGNSAQQLCIAGMKGQPFSLFLLTQLVHQSNMFC